MQLKIAEIIMKTRSLKEGNNFAQIQVELPFN